MMNLHVVMVMALVAVHVARAGAGEAFGGLGDGDLFVATVTQVEDEGATQGKPPLVWLKVHEMLCGKEGAVRSPAVWQAHYHDIDWGDENTPELKRWQATPMKGPDVGKKFILAGKLLEEGQVVSGRGRYLLLPNFRTPFSEEDGMEAEWGWFPSVDHGAWGEAIGGNRLPCAGRISHLPFTGIPSIFRALNDS